MIRELNLFEAPLKGVSLVEAGAGTGKTYNIASLFVRSLIEKRILPSQILVLTYTEAATIELKSRLRARIRESILVLEGGTSEDSFLLELRDKVQVGDLDHLKKSLYHFDEASVSTIHGFCQRLLKDKSIQFDVSPKFEILTDESELLQEIIDNFWRSFIASDGSEFNRNFIHFILDKKYTPEKLLSVVKEIEAKPYAKLIPNTKPIEDFNSIFQSLKDCLFLVKQCFFDQQNELKAILESNSLNGNRYQNRFLHFENVKNWLQLDRIPFTPHEKLYLFSSFMLGDGKKKNAQVPHLSVFTAIDKYLKECANIEKIEISFLKSMFNDVHTKYQELKKDNDLLTYNDLLIRVEQGITHFDSEIAKELRKSYPIALIDEFQDTDPIQYSIFKKIYSNSLDTALFMIGDPKQAIYSFRGADINTYFKAKDDADESQRYSLSSNFRSSKPMIEAVNRIFMKSKNPFSIHSLTFSEAQYPSSVKEEKNRLYYQDVEESALQIVELEPIDTSANGFRASIADSISKEVIDLLSSDYTINDKPIKRNEIAILVRTHRQGLEIQEALREKNVKSLIKSKESVYSTNEAQDLYKILSAILSFTYEDGIRAALSTSLMSFTANEIKDLSNDEPRWNELHIDFLELNELWRDLSFSAMIESLLTKFTLEINLAKFFDSERRLTNLYHIIELLRVEEVQKKLSSSALLNFFRKKMEAQKEGSKEEDLIRLESDQNLVQIVTMHASKGLEYSVVFCPFLWEGIDTKDKSIFSFNKDGNAYLDIGSVAENRTEHRIAFLDDALSERLRLTYVALTRSKSACMVYLVKDQSTLLSPLVSLLQGSVKVKERLFDKIRLSSSQFNSKHRDDLETLSYQFNSLADECLISIRNTKENVENLRDDYLSESQSLSTLNFSRNNLDDYSKITSFSALSDSVKVEYISIEKQGFDYDIAQSIAIHEKVLEHSIYSLPKGAKTGTLLHSIFESITFDNPDTYSKIVSDHVEFYGFDDAWKSTVLELVENATDHFLKDDLRLRDLSKEEILVEMEFHFPISEISPSKVIELIRGTDEEENEVSVHGFMKGFIDLIFQKDGKYFILDYKSNHLGDSLMDYNEKILKEEVLHSNYDLQYHIYTLALHRMLAKSISDYSYQDHFGGVFYLFLRGVNKKSKGSGVFYDKPSFDVIDRLNTYFANGEKT